MLTLEQFGTLEVIEDYLINKMNDKDDLGLGISHHNTKFLQSYLQSMIKYLKYKYNSFLYYCYHFT